MTAVRKLPEAEEDLIGIWLYIASDNPRRADRYLDLLDEKMRLLASSPGLGCVRPELGPGLRGFPVDDYVVFYRAAPPGVEIVRVLHGARDIEALFRNIVTVKQGEP